MMVGAHKRYFFRVDYRQGVEMIIGGYDWVDRNINSFNFPIGKEKGIKRISGELVHFNRLITIDEIFKDLEIMGFRAATIHELVAFGNEYPQLQIQFPIAGVGSVVSMGSRDLDFYDPYMHYVPYLGYDRGKRYLNLRPVNGRWGKIWRFLAIPKR